MKTRCYILGTVLLGSMLFLTMFGCSGSVTMQNQAELDRKAELDGRVERERIDSEYNGGYGSRLRYECPYTELKEYSKCIDSVMYFFMGRASSRTNYYLAIAEYERENYARAYVHLNNIKPGELEFEKREMAHLLAGVCAYSGELGDDQAIDILNRYVKASDDGIYSGNKERYAYALNTIAAAKIRLDATKAAAATAAEEEAAERAAVQAAYDAAAPVPTGTGYDKVLWGANLETVMGLYSDLKVAAEEDNAISYGHENVGGGIDVRVFAFYQEKLFSVIVKYATIPEEDASLLVEKLTSIFGKPIDKAAETDRHLKMDATVYVWKHKGTEVTFRKIGMASTARQIQQELRQHGVVGRQMEQEWGAQADPSKTPCNVTIEYQDFRTIERVQRDNAEREKIKAEEDKKMRSNALGL